MHDSPPGSVNPYQSSELPREAANSTARHYTARLTWSDRQRLLRTIAPTRLCIVAFALLWAKNLYDHVAAWGTALVGDQALLADLPGLLLAGGAILVLTQGVLALYLYWLSWNCVEQFQHFAGGRVASFETWTRQELRLARGWAVMALLQIFVEVSNWAIQRWIVWPVYGEAF